MHGRRRGGMSASPISLPAIGISAAAAKGRRAAARPRGAAVENSGAAVARRGAALRNRLSAVVINASAASPGGAAFSRRPAAVRMTRAASRRGLVSQQNEGCSDRNRVCSDRIWGGERAEWPPPLFVQPVLAESTRLIAFWSTPADERWIPWERMLIACRRIVHRRGQIVPHRLRTVDPPAEDGDRLPANPVAPFANRAPPATNGDRPPPNAVQLPASSAAVPEDRDASAAFGGGTTM